MDHCVIPEPYPDELWYSLVVRYHRHSGNSKITTTKRELFGEEHYLCTMNPRGIDNTLFWYIQKHGWDGEGTVQEKLESALFHHTLLPYYLRFYGAKRKKRILLEIMSENHHRRAINLFTYHENQFDKNELRFCPECIKEDAATYGEAYWHRVHQIWLLQRCPKHGCLLHKSTATSRQASYHFYGPDQFTCASKNNEFQKEDSQGMTKEELWPYVQAALCAPFSFSEQPKVLAIKNRLLELGYGTTKNNGVVYGWTEMQKDMLKYWKKSSRLYEFLNERNVVTIGRVANLYWNSKVEPAILLTAFLKMDYKTMFDSPDVDKLKLEEMIQCYESGLRWTAAKLASHLKVKIKELPDLAKNAGIKPFWREEDKTGKQCLTFRLWFTIDERSRILERMREIRAMDQREYLYYCVRKDMQMSEPKEK